MGVPARHRLCENLLAGHQRPAPNELRRLETRLLVCNADGGVYGVVYKWRADLSDADLLETNLTESIPIRTAAGVRTQSWYYPSRKDCLDCHTANAGYVLGPKTRQLNRDYIYPSGVTDNEPARGIISACLTRTWTRRTSAACPGWPAPTTPREA